MKRSNFNTSHTYDIMVATDSDTDDFVPVVRKKKSYKKHESCRIKLIRDEVITDLRNLLSSCHFSSMLASSFLYGSTAKKQNTNTSDLDIALVFNKKLPDKDVLIETKKTLENMYTRNVDIVCFVVCNKLVDARDERAQNFVDNVRCEGIHICGVDKLKSTEILQFSKLCWKVRY